MPGPQPGHLLTLRAGLSAQLLRGRPAKPHVRGPLHRSEPDRGPTQVLAIHDLTIRRRVSARDGHRARRASGSSVAFGADIGKTKAVVLTDAVTDDVTSARQIADTRFATPNRLIAQRGITERDDILCIPNVLCAEPAD
jgi:hypothetical protein